MFYAAMLVFQRVATSNNLTMCDGDILEKQGKAINLWVVLRSDESDCGGNPRWFWWLWRCSCVEVLSWWWLWWWWSSSSSPSSSSSSPSSSSSTILTFQRWPSCSHWVASRPIGWPPGPVDCLSEVAEDSQFLMNVCVHAAASLTKSCVGSSRGVAMEDPEIWRVFVGHALFGAWKDHRIIGKS